MSLNKNPKINKYKFKIKKWKTFLELYELLRKLKTKIAANSNGYTDSQQKLLDIEREQMYYRKDFKSQIIFHIEGYLKSI